MVRIKESPEDFYVKEVAHLSFEPKGRYAYFLMKKRNLSTLEAIKLVARHLKVPESRIGFGGLKDKRAVTEQFISVDRPKDIRELDTEDLKLKFLGYGNDPVSLGKIEGNYFEVVIRRLGPKKRDFMKDRIPFVKKYGFENYFGEQRFGSVAYAEEFILRYLLREDYEDAVREYLTSMKDKRRRKALLRAWGKWKEFMKVMPPGSQAELGMIKGLARGKSFEEVLSELPKSMKLMFVFAFQSYLWNRYLTTFVVRYFKHCSVPFLKWRLAFTTHMEDSVFEEIRDMEIPFLGTEHRPSNRKVELIIREVLEDEKLSPEDLKAERIGLRLFSDGKRKAFVIPKSLKILEEGKDFVKLSFFLPPGSYATVLLRKLLCSPVDV